MQQKHYENIAVKKFDGTRIINFRDWLAVEAPLEINLSYEDASGNRINESLTITMRTPGNDFELALGFLLTEGLITHATQVAGSSYPSENILLIELEAGCRPDTRQLDRNFYTNSSCGVCGKTSIANIRQQSHFLPDRDAPLIPATLLPDIPEKLRQAQEAFHRTGGLHASGLFDPDGKLLLLREDVGRHNALDKALGAALLQQRVPLHKHLLMLSGRVSFELVQKAAMAGIGFIAAVGAPSTLAVQVAQEYGITLVGFLRDQSFNVYSEYGRLT